MEKKKTGSAVNLIKFLVALAFIGGSYFVFEKIVVGHDLQSSIASEYKFFAIMAVVFVAITIWYFLFGRRARK